jgi:hypothetical protein
MTNGDDDGIITLSENDVLGIVQNNKFKPYSRNGIDSKST